VVKIRSYLINSPGYSFVITKTIMKEIKKITRKMARKYKSSRVKDCRGFITRCSHLLSRYARNIKTIISKRTMIDRMVFF
jgi:rRNA-processing protein FCF1